MRTAGISPRRASLCTVFGCKPEHLPGLLIVKQRLERQRQAYVPDVSYALIISFSFKVRAGACLWQTPALSRVRRVLCLASPRWLLQP